MPFDTISEFPTLAHITVSCVINDTPQRPRRGGHMRTRSAGNGDLDFEVVKRGHSRTASFDHAGNVSQTCAMMDDTFPDTQHHRHHHHHHHRLPFSGTSPTPSNFGVSPLSASPVDAAEGTRWSEDGTTLKKGPRISPVSVLMIPALDLSVDISFDDEMDVGNCGSAMDTDGGNGGGYASYPQNTKSPKFESSPGFRFGTRTTNTTGGPSLHLGSDSFKQDADAAATPKGARLNAPTNGFGTPAGDANKIDSGFKNGFGAIPPTPVRPRRLDEDDDDDDDGEPLKAFGSQFQVEHDSSEFRIHHGKSKSTDHVTDDDWELSSNSDGDRGDDGNVEPVPFSFNASTLGSTQQGLTQGLSQGKPPRRVRQPGEEGVTDEKWKQTKTHSRGFRAPKLERNDSLSQTKLLAQAGLQRSESLKYAKDFPFGDGVGAEGGVIHSRSAFGDVDVNVDANASPSGRQQKPSSIPDTFTFESHFSFHKVLGKTPTSEAWLVTSKVSGVKAIAIHKIDTFFYRYQYCVKRITKQFRNVRERELCLHEVVAVTNLPAHENVVKYHRAWQEDRHFFTQMEVCERGSFGACLGKLRGWAEGTTTAAGDRYGQTDWSTSIHSSASSAKTFDDGNETVPTTHLLAERDVWRFASDVASGLAHCHVHGVLHLDIKPENVFISSNGCYKIGDFGVAWIANRGWEVLDGDGGFVAPEVLRGEWDSVGNSGDCLHVEDGMDGKVGDQRTASLDAFDSIPDLAANSAATGGRVFAHSDGRITTSKKQPVTPTDRADVFSLGASLFEAAAGARLPSEWRLGVPTWSEEQGVTDTTGQKGVTEGVTPEEEGSENRTYWDGLELPVGRSDELRKYITMCLRAEPTHRPSASDLAKHAAMIEKMF